MVNNPWLIILLNSQLTTNGLTDRKILILNILNSFNPIFFTANQITAFSFKKKRISLQIKMIIRNILQLLVGYRRGLLHGLVS